MTTYLPRSSWSARPPNRSVSGFGTKKGVCIHHGGTGHPTSVRQAKSLIRGYQNYHLDYHKWADIAYNFLVDPYGNIYVGRGWNTRSGANGTTAANASYLAICIVGHTDRGSLTQAAKDSLVQVRTDALSRGFGTQILPHRYFTGSSCPGLKGREFVKNGNWNTIERSWFEMASKDELEKIVRDVVKDEIWRAWQYKGSENRDAWSILRSVPSEAADEVWSKLIGHGANLRASTLLSRLGGGGIDEVLSALEEVKTLLEEVRDEHEDC